MEALWWAARILEATCCIAVIVYVIRRWKQ